MSSNFIDVLGHQLHYLEWKTEGLQGKDATAKGCLSDLTVVMVHGLTRTASDFEHMGEFLTQQSQGGLLSVRALSFDVIGRGMSSWAATSKTPDEATKDDYNVPFYIQLFKAALPLVGITGDGSKSTKCAWVGTSMGGLIGFIGYGSGELRPLIHTLVLNDIGPHVPRAALKIICDYTLHPPTGASYLDFESSLKGAMSSFGEMPPSVLRAITKAYCRRDAHSGGFSVHYDERILHAIRAMFRETPVAAEGDIAMGTADSEGAEAVLWALLGNVDAPLLLFRGETSVVLLAETAERMMHQPQQKCERKLITVPKCGHAPALFERENLHSLYNFLISSLESQ